MGGSLSRRGKARLCKRRHLRPCRSSCPSEGTTSIQLVQIDSRGSREDSRGTLSFLPGDCACLGGRTPSSSAKRVPRLCQRTPVDRACSLRARWHLHGYQSGPADSRSTCSASQCPVTGCTFLHHSRCSRPAVVTRTGLEGNCQVRNRSLRLLSFRSSGPWGRARSPRSCSCLRASD